jgi:hypothetical protein
VFAVGRNHLHEQIRDLHNDGLSLA